MRLRYEQLQHVKGTRYGCVLKSAATALLLLITTLCVVYQDKQNVQNASQALSTLQRISAPNSTTPLIVAWTGFFDMPFTKLLSPSLRNCGYKCDFVDRKRNGNFDRRAAAYIIHGRNMVLNDLPKQSPEHLNILFLLESPFHTGSTMYQVPRDYFNATTTYRLDSDYFYPYGVFQSRMSNDTVDIITQEELLSALKRKKNGSLIFVSNCRTPSNREKTIRELGKFTEITVRGGCENALSVNDNTKSSSCRADCSDDGLIATHRFYIAFENSDCNDYITEKYYMRISQLLVPVVMRRRIYERAGLPKDSFVAVDDFKSLEDLGNYLNFLRKNNTEYLRYFEWTKHFRKPDAYVSNVLCRLCEDIYKRKRLRINDVRQYYEKDQCF